MFCVSVDGIIPMSSGLSGLSCPLVASGLGGFSPSAPPPDGVSPAGYAVTLKIATPPGVTGTLLALHVPSPLFVPATPFTHTLQLESETVPFRFASDCHNASPPSPPVIASAMSLWMTLMLVTLTLPAASVTISVRTFVPPFNGMLSTQNRPSRSTWPLNVFVSPFVSTNCAAIVAIGSSTKPSSVKPVPATFIPFCGHLRLTTGGFVRME